MKKELDIQRLAQNKIKLIADALNTTANYILGIDDETERNEQILCDLFLLCYGKESYNIVKDFLKLDLNDRAVVSAMIQSLLSTDKYNLKQDAAT